MSATRIRRLLHVLPAAALAIAAACSDSAAPAGPALVQTQHTASGYTGPYVIRGTVIAGTGTFPDSTQPIAGVVLTVLYRVPPAPGTDSSAVTTTSIGTVTSAANGTFELDGVPDGYFLLDAAPPAGSGYRPGRAGTISFAPTSTARSYVYLYK